jgi:hypothetical protein
MSILSTTKRGYDYYKWRDEIKWFAKRVLCIVNSSDLQNKEYVQIEYKLPMPNDTTVRTSFTFKPTLTTEEFVEEFIEDMKDKMKTNFDKYVVNFVVPYKLYIK